MKIKTKSFDLAIYQKGDEGSGKLALVLPGKLDSKDYANMRSHVELFASHNYLAVSIDPPGTWESEGSVEEYNFPNYLKAVEEVIDYYSKDEVLLVGHSMGGTLAMLSLNNPRVVGIVAIMAPYKFGDSSGKTGSVSRRDLPGNPEIEKEIILPDSFYKDLDKYDTVSILSNSEKPKLFIYSKSDEFVSPESVEEIYNLSKEPKKLVELKADHTYRKSKESVEEVNKVIEEFLNEN